MADSNQQAPASGASLGGGVHDWAEGTFPAGSRGGVAMTERRVVLATRAPLLARWQVAAPADGLSLFLIGWRVSPELEIDGGMPNSVARLLAGALSRAGALTYPCSSEPPPSADSRVQVLNARWLGERVRSALSHTPSKFWLVTTREPLAVRHLLDDGGFPWWLQGQSVLLSLANSEVAPERARLLKLMDPQRALRREDLTALSLLAVVQPGVDGDVAAVVSLSVDVEGEILAAIEREARECGFKWLLVSESDFADTLSEAGTAALGTA